LPDFNYIFIVSLFKLPV